MDTEEKVDVEPVVEPIVEPVVEPVDPTIELEAIKVRFDMLMKLIEEEDGGFHDFICQRNPILVQKFKDAGFEYQHKTI
tara:strand:+ start:4381 stop:4617 length:237 start_codon:yes stop_codon:yes gene_type:complete